MSDSTNFINAIIFALHDEWKHILMYVWHLIIVNNMVVRDAYLEFECVDFVCDGHFMFSILAQKMNKLSIKRQSNRNSTK